MFGFFKKKSEARSLTIDDLIANMGAANTGAGEYVSPYNAETLPAVLNAVNVIAQAVAAMPCYLFEISAEGRKRIENHSVEYLLNEMPNRNQTPSRLSYPAYLAFVKAKNVLELGLNTFVVGIEQAVKQHGNKHDFTKRKTNKGQRTNVHFKNFDDFQSDILN